MEISPTWNLRCDISPDPKPRTIPGRVKCFIRAWWMDWKRQSLHFILVKTCLYDSLHLNDQEFNVFRRKIWFRDLHQFGNPQDAAGRYHDCENQIDQYR